MDIKLFKALVNKLNFFGHACYILEFGNTHTVFKLFATKILYFCKLNKKNGGKGGREWGERLDAQPQSDLLGHFTI